MQGEQRRQTAMGPKNYGIPPCNYERTDDQGFYILEVTPRIKINSCRGRIWVDGQDFAVGAWKANQPKTPRGGRSEMPSRHL